MPDRRSHSGSTRRGNPNLAVLLTWLVPGAGHLYLGRAAFGLAAFAVVEGLYLAGLYLSGGMFLEYLPPEMRGRFAAALTPEVANLGALFWHVERFGYGPGHPRPWPPAMDLGTTLTAASGVLNLFLMARVHFDARLAAHDARVAPPIVAPPIGSGARAGRLGPAGAAFLTWVSPGLGHLAQGRRLRGVLVFVLLVGLFLFGTWLAQGSNLDRERHFYYWAGQFLLGPPAILVEFLHGHQRVTGEVPYADGGVVIASIAGMLNVLCMLDVYGWGEWRLLGEPEPRAGEAEAAA